jgi:RNA polymerase sigma-70 factor, ECF subfamily
VAILTHALAQAEQPADGCHTLSWLVETALARGAGDGCSGEQPWQAPNAAHLKALYDRHARAILAHCKRLLGSAEAGEDATQEVFVRALRQSGRWPAETELEPWLFRIATNYCLNELRSRRLRAHGPPQLAPPLASNLEARLMARSEMGHLFERLPKRAQEVARLTHVEGMLQHEVAEALGISRRTVVSCLTQLRSHV